MLRNTLKQKAPKKTVLATKASLENKARSDKKSELWDEKLQRFVLQEVIISSNATALAPKLYHDTLLGEVEKKNQAISVSAGGKIGFNNYANSFFASYWEEHTNITTISLSGEIEGTAKLDLYRSSPNGKLYHIGSYVIADLFHIHFDLFDYVPSDGGVGRYFFDIKADTNILIKRAAFCAFVPPVKEVSLSLGLCTYKKERYISNLALALDRYFKNGGTAVSSVIVVNNDSDFKKLPILKQVAGGNKKFTLIAQDNIGGAGGFARTLHESLKSQDTTHHIFMDDDIFLDTNMLDRLRAFVSYMDKPCVVGGHMMDMANPKMVYEGGAKLDYWGFLSKVGANIDGSAGGEVTFFDKLRSVDYNAWWFACVPTDTARKIGLPLNIFIRGDDFEYGLRMRREGVKTVSLPGLFVWHEPFEGKNSSWLEYYNWRNRLVICSIYGDPERLDVQPADMLRDIIVNNLDAGNYEVVLVMGMALIDFLRGPETILKLNATERHNELRKVIARIVDNSADVAAELQSQLETLGGADVIPNSMNSIMSSPALGGRPRMVKQFSWIKDPVVGVLDEILARYALGAIAAKEDWKTKAHDLSTSEAWEELYWDAKTAK